MSRDFWLIVRTDGVVLLGYMTLGRWSGLVIYLGF